MADAVDVFEIIRKAGTENDPHIALERLLEDCGARIGATRSRLYLLNLAKTAYVQEAAHPAASSSTVISLLHDNKDRDDPCLREVIRTHKVLRLPTPTPAATKKNTPRPESRMIVPILRDQVCLGLFDFDAVDREHFTLEHEELIRVPALFAVLICEKEDVLNLLGQLHKPVDYYQGFSEFLDTIILLVAAASQMPLIALRELRDDTLHCLRAYGFTDLTEEDLHLAPMADYPLFERVVREREIVVSSGHSDGQVRDFLARLHLDQVQSFIIVPVLVGTEIFGTLSFAVLCDHEYTALEQQGLSAIANAVGVAISNYRNFQNAEEHLFNEAKVAAAITTVDVAQSARHEARNYLNEAQGQLILLTSKLDSLPTKTREEFREHLLMASDKMLDVEAAMQKIKTISKPPDREKVAMRMDTLWREALLTLWRLEQQQIRWNVKGNATAKVAPDYVKTAFLNLILNSLDAFRTAKKKGRMIEVTIESPSERAKDIVIRYVDNASGIDLSKLPPLPDGTVRSINDVFEPGVTSKPEGSGYGLYLVRKILGEHHGSIDLLDHRNGVVFQIKLPQHV